MAIQTIDEEGNLTWNCPHWPEEAEAACGTPNSAHISHEAIQWNGIIGEQKHKTVSLPPCSGCGAQTFLKVSFTEKELHAPNMWLAWTSERAQALVDFQTLYQVEPEGTPQKAALAHQIAKLQAIQKAGGLHTESHAMAMRHVEMARQLVAAGKTPPGQGE